MNLPVPLRSLLTGRTEVKVDSVLDKEFREDAKLRAFHELGLMPQDDKPGGARTVHCLQVRLEPRVLVIDAAAAVAAMQQQRARDRGWDSKGRNAWGKLRRSVRVGVLVCLYGASSSRVPSESEPEPRIGPRRNASILRSTALVSVVLRH